MSDSTRIHAKPEELVPRVLVRVMFALVLTILALVTVARLTDRPLEATPSAAPILSERLIHLSSDASGAARVLDMNGTVVASFGADKGGFVSGIDRVIRRQRSRAGVLQTAPVALRLRVDEQAGHRLSIYDPETGWSAELMGFGADNLRTFARLLEPPTKEGSQ